MDFRNWDVHSLQWQDPVALEENREAPRAYFIPYDSAEKALKGIRGQSPFYRLLNGNWKFSYYEKFYEAPEDFYRSDFDVSGWAEIPVPKNWHR